jgi:hypothetical protein
MNATAERRINNLFMQALEDPVLVAKPKESLKNASGNDPK